MFLSNSQKSSEREEAVLLDSNLREPGRRVSALVVLRLRPTMLPRLANPGTLGPTKDSLRSRIAFDQRSDGTSELKREVARERVAYGAYDVERGRSDAEGDEAAKVAAADDDCSADPERSGPPPAIGFKTSRLECVCRCNGSNAGNVCCFGGRK